MSYGAFCLLASFDARHRARVVYQDILRARFRREAAALSARLWAQVEARMNFTPGIARDIREWRTEL